MGDEDTTAHVNDTGDTGSVPGSNRLRQWFAAHRNRLPTKRRIIAAAYGLFVASSFVGSAAAQSAGSQICGTAIAKTVNKTAPLVLAIVVGGGLMLGYLLHAWSGFKKDPNKVQNIRDWRNRAITSAVTAPLLGKLLEIIIGFIGFGLAGCIDIVPGI
jgi:hypothetical protein